MRICCWFGVPRRSLGSGRNPERGSDPASNMERTGYASSQLGSSFRSRRDGVATRKTMDSEENYYPKRSEAWRIFDEPPQGDCHGFSTGSEATFAEETNYSQAQKTIPGPLNIDRCR